MFVHSFGESWLVVTRNAADAVWLRRRGSAYIRPTTKGAIMKIHYHFRQLSRDEEENITMVLFEEIELQRWFVVEFNVLMDEEVFLALQ